MVSYTSHFLVFGFVLPYIQAAPVKQTFSALKTRQTALDANAMLQNAKDAQNLNFGFQNLTADDPCNGGDTACITASGSSNKAECNAGKWELSPCPSSLSCFAKPSVTQQGNNITCTSENDLLATLKAMGVTDGKVAVEASSTNATGSPSGSIQGSGAGGSAPSQSSLASSTAEAPSPSASGGTGGGKDVGSGDNGKGKDPDCDDDNDNGGNQTGDSDDGDCSDDSGDGNGSNDPDDSNDSGKSDSGAVKTVTVTLSDVSASATPSAVDATGQQASSVTQLPPTTQTLPPDVAASLISSLTANGGSVVTAIQPGLNSVRTDCIRMNICGSEVFS